MNFAVNFWYGFDSDHATYLFSQIEDAKNFLRENYEWKIKSDKECGYEIKAHISEDGYEAKILELLPSGKTSTTIMFVSSIYQ